MAIRVLEETGLLPHLNPGVMSWEELNRLKPVSPSMGMMLETTSRRLFETKGEAHFGSPDKDPEVRLRVLEDAGRLSIPFTTGLLVGIGETLTERAETILALRATSRAYGAVQEVIVQNFRAKPDTAMRHADDLGLDEYRAAIAVTRLAARPQGAGAGAAEPGRPRGVPGPARRRRRRLGRRLAADPRPREPRAALAQRWSGCAAITAECGFELTRAAHRAPRVRPSAASRGSTPGSRRTSPRWRATTGWPSPASGPTGLPWQEPDGGFACVGRTDLFEAVDRDGPRAAPTTGARTSPTSTATGTRSRPPPTG